MTLKSLLPYALTVLVTAALIYLTPLKWVTIIEPTINDIDPTEFYNLYTADPDHYIFLDVRSKEAYDEGHAEGSVSAPLHTLYDLRHSLPKNGKEIVLICSGGRASGVGYSYLEHYGFFNIRRIEGGIENWILEGLPTVKTGEASSTALTGFATCPA
jgi:rhodanese-related sulfurtransferase